MDFETLRKNFATLGYSLDKLDHNITYSLCRKSTFDEIIINHRQAEYLWSYFDSLYQKGWSDGNESIA